MSDVRTVLAEAAAELERADALLEHAKRATYQAGCRCRSCSEANTVYQREYRRKLLTGRPILGAVVNGDATAKRVRALRAEGYTFRELACRLGLSAATVCLHTRSIAVEWRTAAKIARFWQSQQVD